MNSKNAPKVYELHVEHHKWLENLKFYDDEIGIFKARIQEVATQNSGKDTLKKVEHFQNSLIIQKHELDKLVETIKKHELEIEKNVDSNPAADHLRMADHIDERERMETFERLFKEMKDELYQFVGQVF